MSKPLIIAEFGSNHLGDMDLAQRMIDAAAKAHVDVVKFQSWQADRLIASYPDYEKMMAWYKKTELTDEKHWALKKACENAGMEFLTSVFDLSRVAFLAELGLKRIKIASPDCGSTALLKAVRDRFPEILVSTGMSTDVEVLAAAQTLKGHSFTLLHCVSKYPTPLSEVNLSRMDWLATLCPSVGFSDHTMGPTAAKMALAHGAKYVEKHFTLDQTLPGPDQKMSSPPDVFREIADWRNQWEECRGQDHRPLTEAEDALRKKYIGKWGNNR
jgi:N,N'-diacetyllegionaminate synthase